MAAKSAPVLAWIDLEMTGLEPEQHHILELALVLTDAELKPLAAPLNLVVWQPERHLEQMSPFVRKMHNDSGLLERVRTSPYDLRDVEQAVMGLLTQHAGYREARLCGNSIASDRKFIDCYMPQLAGYLHYRMIDVSTLKELSRWWYDAEFPKPQDGKHTASFDIEQSIAELRFYREKILK